jgi:phage/plasmid-like protein (TIGR03299 family)
MAHNISTASGRAEMFYVGTVPWHGLGTKVEGSVTSEQALTAAGLDWTVRLEDMTSTSGLSVPMGQAVIRDDVNAVLGMVGRRWKPVQNRDAFGFLDSLVGDRELFYETAGALGQGERVWMMARMPQDLRIKGTEDITKPYLLLSNMHDGFGSLRCFFTGVRVVCQNTLNMASSRKALASGVTIRHTGDLTAKIDEARRVLGLAAEFFRGAEQDMNRLAAAEITPKESLAYFTMLFPDPEKPAEQKVAARNAEETRTELCRLVEHGAGANMKGAKRSYWTAYNAVTEYVDHVVKAKDAAPMSLEAQESRLASALFGTGAALKAKAWDVAYQTVASRN